MKNFAFITLIVLSIGCKKNMDRDLGEGYRLIASQAGDPAIVFGINEPYTGIVQGSILKVAFDSKFIIASQRPIDSIPECTGKIPGMTKKKCREAFEKSTIVKYWIINKKETMVFDENSKKYNNAYGPFSIDQFKTKRIELGVSNNLQLP